MRLTSLAIGLAVLGILAVGRPWAPALADDEAKAHGPIAWTVSLDDAKKTAAKEKKPIFMDFWAPWCGPCKQMLKTTYQDKAVVERSKQFVPVLVNFDKQPALVKRYNVGQIPVVLFLDTHGKVLKRAEFMDAKAMLKAMDEVAKKAR
jgi:thioredoxin-like negative regulator of GroEL